MDLKYIINQYCENNKTLREIAREFDTTHQRIKRILNSNGIKTLNKRPRRKIVDTFCGNCQKPLRRYPSTTSKDCFCSYECYHTWMVGKNIGEKSASWKGGITAISSNNLKTPEFVRLKKIVLTEFPICVICGNDNKLHVHHIQTRREYPEMVFVKENLITLCIHCHSKIKGKEKQWETYFMRIISKSGELLETPNVKTRTISSQALEGIGTKEGSTTISLSPNNNSWHECPTRKGRYSLNLSETVRGNV